MNFPAVTLYQGSATYGPRVRGIWPARQNHPARRPFTNCSNFMAHL